VRKSSPWWCATHPTSGRQQIAIEILWVTDADMSEIVDDAVACKDGVGEHKIANRVPERG